MVSVSKKIQIVSIFIVSLFLFSCSENELSNDVDILYETSEVEKRSSERGEEGCCDYDLDIQVIDSNPRCCIYKILITNNGECRMALFDEKGRRYMVIGAKKSNYITVRRCVWEDGPLTFKIMSNSEVCDTFVLDAGCNIDQQVCCDFTYTASYLGTINGCCRFEVVLNNSTDCDIFLFTANGLVHTFVANQYGQLLMNRCSGDPDLNEVHYLGYTLDNEYACDSFELEGCTEED